MKAIRKPFTHKLQIIKAAVKELQNTNFYAIIVILLMLVGFFTVSFAISSLMESSVIKNTGEILTGAYARSGSARDIQAAVDWVVTNGSIGNVYIPQGTFNLVEPGEPWVTVNIPAGVNVFGAFTERGANGQVVEWKTILVMPYDVPGPLGNSPFWFRITGNGDPNKPSRFSDIKLVGYRTFDPNSTTLHSGISIKNVVDFRVDHCYFEHTCGGGISTFGLNCRGVIDHCFFVNHHGHVESAIANCTVDYGICFYREYGDVWEDDVSKVLGQYTDYTIFIEDCYFEKWRHCTAANAGAHYVIRYSTIKNDYGFGSIDSHGWGDWDGTKVVMVGTRATEIYGCTIIDAVESPWATFIRGGAGIAFGNTVGGGTYTTFLYFSNEADPEVLKCWVHDWYIWNNTMLGGTTEIIEYDPNNQITEGVDYFLYQPGWYEPYPYPHPLTLEATP